jgi:hypothetical protein
VSLPPRYRDIVLSEADPGEAYRRCVAELRAEGRRCDYDLTEALVYACEVRYALDVIRHGRPDRWWNFGDPAGDAEARLWTLLDPLVPLNLAFVGAGPFPVTALLVADRYPDARITCVDNNVAAYLLCRAVLERLGLAAADTELRDALDVDYSRFNAVIVAAMVGGKRGLCRRILSTSDAVVVARSRVDLSHPRLVQFPSPFGDDGALDGTLA